MAYNEALATRIRQRFARQPEVVEKKMFGSLAFMLDGHLVCGALHDDLMARVGARNYEDALALPDTRPMEMKGRPMAGFVLVKADSLSDAALTDWINRALTFTATLPPKK